MKSFKVTLMLICSLLVICACAAEKVACAPEKAGGWSCIPYKAVPKTACECRQLLADAIEVRILDIDIIADLETGKMTAMIEYYTIPVINRMVLGVILVTFKAFPHIKEIYIRHPDNTINQVILENGKICIRSIKDKKNEQHKERKSRDRPRSSTI